MENRDFKGVWIPKEIWLSKELTMTEKVILTEIASLDNENHCSAGNEYFAEFCNCGVATVTRSIKHLEEMGYIKIISFDGRRRLIKMMNQPNQNDEAESSKRLTNNIDNNTTSKKDTILSKDNIVESQPILDIKPKKKSLYMQATDFVDETFDDLVLRENLKDWIKFMFNIYREQCKTLYLNVIKSKINRLLTFKPEDRINIVITALDNGWQNFYEPKEKKQFYRGKEVFGEDEFINCKKASKEELSGQAF